MSTQLRHDKVTQLRLFLTKVFLDLFAHPAGHHLGQSIAVVQDAPVERIGEKLVSVDNVCVLCSVYSEYSINSSRIYGISSGICTVVSTLVV